MKKKYIMSLDQGTTSSRAVIFDHNQNIISMVQREYTQYYPKEGWVEHDPMDIYATQYSVMMEAIVKCEVNPEEIAGIGITNQRETTIVWEKSTGRPIYNAIVWQCRRTADICDKIKENHELTEYIKDNTGLVPDAYFSATKIKWILDNVEGARKKAERGELLFGTVDTWLVWKLTGGKSHVTDYTNASRTMLFNIKTLKWDERLLKEFGIPASMLPKVCNCSEIYGYTDVQNAKVPICGMAGDQQAALFGQTCFNVGEAKNTYGTGCFLLMNTGEKICKSENGLLTTIAMGIDGKITYALEGSVFVGGAVIQWLRDEMRFISESRDVEYYAGKVKDTAGVYFVPAFTGLGAPYWDMYARGCIIGITRGTKREHIIRAAEEAIAYQSMELVRAMEQDTGKKIEVLNVDGGASRDKFLMQFQSDILNTEIFKPVVNETTALGAAYLAGLAVNFWKSLDEIKSLRKCDAVYKPDFSEEKREKLISQWKKAVGRSRNWTNN